MFFPLSPITFHVNHKIHLLRIFHVCGAGPFRYFPQTDVHRETTSPHSPTRCPTPQEFFFFSYPIVSSVHFHFLFLSLSSLPLQLFSIIKKIDTFCHNTTIPSPFNSSQCFTLEAVLLFSSLFFLFPCTLVVSFIALLLFEILRELATSLLKPPFPPLVTFL